MLGASRIYTSMGGVHRELLLGVEHLFPPASRRHSCRRVGVREDQIHRLLPVDVNSFGGSGYDVVGATPPLACLFASSSPSAQIRQGGFHSRPRIAPKSRLLPRGHVGGAGGVAIAISAHEVLCKPMPLWHPTQCTSYISLPLCARPLHCQLFGSDLSDEVLHWLQ